MHVNDTIAHIYSGIMNIAPKCTLNRMIALLVRKTSCSFRAVLFIFRLGNIHE